jgi:hypothetical protein
MSTEELRALDPVRNAVEEYVEELDAVFGRLGLTVEESAFTASDIYREAKRSSMVHSDGIDVQQPVHPKLRSLFSRDGRVMNVKAIGWVLRKHRGRRTSAGLAIELARTQQGKAEHLYIISKQMQ